MVEAPTKSDWLDYLRYFATWATGRGAVSILVAACSWAIGTGAVAWLPFVAIPLAGAISLFSKGVWHKHEQRVILDEYREQIAATLGIAPEAATVEHLHKVAYGDPEQNLPGNKTLREALRRNDRDWWIKVVSDTLSAALILGGMFSLSIHTAAQQQEMRYIGMAIGAGIVNMGLSYAFRFIGDDLTDQNRPLLYDKIHTIRRSLKRGIKISPNYVMELFVSRDKELGRFIQETYGAPFRELPMDVKREILDGLEPTYHVRAYTQAINEERISPNELAFALEGLSSGVPIKDPGSYHQETVRERLGQYFGQYHDASLPLMIEKRSVPLPEGEATYAVAATPDGKWTQAVGQERQERRDQNSYSFVERYASSTRDMRSFAERLEQEISTPASHRIH